MRAPRWLSSVRHAAGKVFKPVPDVVTVDAPDQHEVLDMIASIGVALLDSNSATSEVISTLVDIAGAYKLGDIQIVVFPTAVIVQHTGGDYRAEIKATDGSAVRLDQIGALDELTKQARLGTIAPSDLMESLRNVLQSKPRFGPWLMVLGHTILTLGFGFMLNPTLNALPIYIGLGLAVGALILLGQKIPTLAVAMPVFAAFTATALTALFFADWAGESPLRVITPALISFLPGMLLTVAAIELTTGQVISGATRLVYGTAQLVLLAFGVAAGFAIVGTIPAHEATANNLGVWTPLVGITLLAIGYTLFFSAPKGASVWLLLSLLVTYSAQSIGTLIIGAELSSFVGALVVIPFARLASRFKTAPPAAVLTLASYWILVPGALGFLSLDAAKTSAAQSLQGLISTGLSMFAIALGILVSNAITENVISVAKRRRLRAGA